MIKELAEERDDKIKQLVYERDNYKQSLLQVTEQLECLTIKAAKL